VIFKVPSNPNYSMILCSKTRYIYSLMFLKSSLLPYTLRNSVMPWKQHDQQVIPLLLHKRCNWTSLCKVLLFLGEAVQSSLQPINQAVYLVMFPQALQEKQTNQKPFWNILTNKIIHKLLRDRSSERNTLCSPG